MNRTPLHKVEILRRHQALYFRKHQGQVSLWIFKVLLFVSSLAKLVVWLVRCPLGGNAARARVQVHWHTVGVALSL
jgi:hypothetical protein